MQTKIQVVIIDDHVIFRNGVISILQMEPDIEVVGQGASAEEAVQLAHDLMPDVILLDISIPGNGLNAARQIAQANPAVKIVMLTALTADDLILEAFQVGAQAFLFKGVVTSEIVNILNDVNTGVRFLPVTLAELLLDPRVSTAVAPQTRRNVQEKLTDRERQVLTLIAENNSLIAIAAKLNLPERLIKKIVTNIIEKLDLHVVK